VKLPYEIPAGLLGQAALGPDWADFVRRLPRVVDEITDDWRLTYDGAPSYGYTGLVLPVVTDDGRRAALKVGYLDEESAGEPVALQLWGGQGAVELWSADPRRGAMLLERLGPEDLNVVEDLESCRVVGELYGLLHRPPTPRLTDVRQLAVRWLDRLSALPRGAISPRFVEQALAAAPRLLAHESTAVIHGDLHCGNVLAGARRDWLVIDPKGFAGDPSYELAPMLLNRWSEVGDDPGTRVRDRFYTLVDTAGLDERRCRDWAVLRSVLAVSWEYVAAAGHDLTVDQREWVTSCITVAKAMQAV
jgi:streptomycin 6-kinase